MMGTKNCVTMLMTSPGVGNWKMENRNWKLENGKSKLAISWS
jgi:hypothetical protein